MAGGYPQRAVNTVIETASGTNEARTVIVEEATDATGVATFDLTQFAISEIFDFAVEVIDDAVDLAALVFAHKLAISNTACTCVGYTSDALTGVLAAVGAGVNIRVKILCR
ncbi:MAG: hypothetical protein KTR16_11650 [Acidiferrobacterales bacterium]|nr:hypothetical protein [Acidiferrobacterales bacterium]